MNKSVFGFLIGILLLLSTSLKGQQISLPDTIVDKIITELAWKDHLTFVVDQQAGLLKVYQHSDSLQKQEIKDYKIKVVNNELIIADLNTKVKLTEDEVKLLKAEARKQKWKRVVSFLEGTLVGILIILLVK